MSFQAYIDTIKTKTGKTPDEFFELAKQKGLLEPGVPTMQIVDWLKQDYDLGRGHSMALVVTFNARTQPAQTAEEGIASHFSGHKHRWRHAYDELARQVREFGPDVSVKPGGSYLSLLRGAKKFAIVQITGERMDIGIKRKGVDASGRFALAGTWNSMVTHRVAITDAAQIDADLLDWLRSAYDVA